MIGGLIVGFLLGAVTVMIAGVLIMERRDDDEEGSD